MAIHDRMVLVKRLKDSNKNPNETVGNIKDFRLFSSLLSFHIIKSMTLFELNTLASIAGYQRMAVNLRCYRVTKHLQCLLD